jgi:hypothetical protein
MRWIVSGQMTESVTVGGVVEMNMPNSNGTYAMGNGTSTADSTGDNAWGMRKTEITFAHKAAGKLSLGQGSSAGDGASTQSLGSWGPSMSAQGAAGTGNTALTNSAGVSQSVLAKSANASYDPGRVDRVRYDTPSFGGFALNASLGSQTNSAVGATYGGKFGGVQVAAAAFYSRSDGAGASGVEGTMGGSVAVKHDSGISAHLGYTKETSISGVIEGKEIHGGIGYAASLTNLGTTGFAVNYTQSDDTTSSGDEGSILGVAVNQNISAVGTDVFVSYSRVTYDDTSATNYDDFSAIMVGSVLAF